MQIRVALQALVASWFQTDSPSAATFAVTAASAAQPPLLAAGAAVIIVALLLLLFLYRRRFYILYWVAGWAFLAASVASSASAQADTQTGAIVYGLSQCCSVIAALCFVIAADAYDVAPSLQRRHLALAVPLVLWFVLAPMALGRRAVLMPGHLLTASALAVAGRAHLQILRNARLLGAGVVGTMLLVSSGIHFWIIVAPGGQALAAPEALLLQLALFLITALGMQLMTFEDMTNELRGANARLELAQSELRQMVVTDALTGARNRRFFDEIIARELSMRRRYATPLSLMFIDIDCFKVINDTQGHAAGDCVLREVASFLMRKVRDADYVFRWGGDEFLLMLSCREDEALRRGKALQLDFTRSPIAVGLPSGVGLSFGCAEVPQDAESVQDSLKLADQRMYQNKRTARMSDVKAV